MKNLQVLRPDFVWTEEGLRSDLCVRIHASSIVEVCAAERYPHAKILPGKLLLPGFVNAHSHAFQRAFRGHVQWSAHGTDDFWSWRDRMYSMANSLGPEQLFKVSRLAFLEMAEAGFTAVGEFHYLHRTPEGQLYNNPDELAEQVIAAALDVGIRVCLLRVVYAQAGFDKPLQINQQRFRTDNVDEALRAVDRLNAHTDPRVSVGLAPHSVRAVPADWLPELAAFNGPLHAHVSEQPREVEACLASTGRTPLGLFDDAGLLKENFTAVHLTHPTSLDLERMRATGARICVCPTTELDLGDGFFPVDARTGIPLCIGSDSHAQINPLGEVRALELHGRALAQRRLIFAEPGERHSLATNLLRVLTANGGQSLGINHRTLGVISGMPADLVALDLTRPAAVGVPPIEAALFASSPEWITDVWVGGEQIVEDGVHLRRDKILREALGVLQQQ